MANKSENKKKRKAPEKRIEGGVCVNGGWCGRFVITVCLNLGECLYLEQFVCTWRSRQRSRKELNCVK